VTRSLDVKRRVWEISEWPIRSKLAFFERRRVQQAQTKMGDVSDAALLLAALQKCTAALDGRPGCGAFLKYQGRHASKNASRRRLEEFLCSNENCEIRWERRLFNSLGAEVARNQIGGERTRSPISVPRTARRCPICDARLGFPKEFSKIGGATYDPPLLRLSCSHAGNVDHVAADRRKELALPPAFRKGQTFYYNRKESRFVDISRSRRDLRRRAKTIKD
jgi:hypothetical protein